MEIDRSFQKAFFLILFLSGCAHREVVKPLSETRIEITPEELARYTETKSEIFAQEIASLKEEFRVLRREIAKEVKDCICPTEMK